MVLETFASDDLVPDFESADEEQLRQLTAFMNTPVVLQILHRHKTVTSLRMGIVGSEPVLCVGMIDTDVWPVDEPKLPEEINGIRLVRENMMCTQTCGTRAHIGHAFSTTCVIATGGREGERCASTGGVVVVGNKRFLSTSAHLVRDVFDNNEDACAACTVYSPPKLFITRDFIETTPVLKAAYNVMRKSRASFATKVTEVMKACPASKEKWQQHLSLVNTVGTISSSQLFSGNFSFQERPFYVDIALIESSKPLTADASSAFMEINSANPHNILSLPDLHVRSAKAIAANEWLFFRHSGAMTLRGQERAVESCLMPVPAHVKFIEKASGNTSGMSSVAACNILRLRDRVDAAGKWVVSQGDCGSWVCSEDNLVVGYVVGAQASGGIGLVAFIEPTIAHLAAM